MPLLALIIALIIGVAIWWWRAQQGKRAADSRTDAADKARDMVSRGRFQHRAGLSVLAGVDTPGMAAATLIYSLMSLRGPVVPADEDKIEAMLETTCQMNRQQCADAMAFAAWASGQVPDTSEIIRRFIPLWANALEPAQRQELVDMALQAVKLNGEPTDAQAAAVKQLSEGLLPLTN